MQQTDAISHGLDTWADAVRTRIGELPHAPGQRDVENLLDRLIQVPWLPGCPCADTFDTDGPPRRYRRHLLASGARDGYSALLISWPPGHQTPLHDHDGLWGIELVLDGAIAIEEFTRSGMPRYPALEHRRTLILGIGDATKFTRGEYVHSCRNLSAQRQALSLHVYGGVLEEYSTFHTGLHGRCTTTRTRAIVDTVLA